MNRQYTAELEFWDFSIVISSNYSELIDKCKQLTEIAGIPISESPCLINKKPNIELLADTNSNIEFDSISGVLKVTAQWDDFLAQEKSLRDVIGQYISYVTWKNGVYPIHSASVSKQEKATLIVGPSGAGKTNLLYILCKCLGYHVLSNDWAGIGYKQNKIVVEKGHDYISFSKQGLEQLKHNEISVPEYVRLEENEIKTSYYSASELHIKEGQLPVPLTVILFVNLRETGELRINPVSQESALRILLKELIWVLRGCGTFLVYDNGKAVSISTAIEPNNSSPEICALANLIVQRCKIYSLTGSVESIIENKQTIESVLNTTK